MSPVHPAMRTPRTKEQRALALHNTPIGLIEIAALLGVSKHTPLKWRQRNLTPDPIPGWSVGGDPVWRKLVVLVWALRTGRIDALAFEELAGLVDGRCEKCAGGQAKHRNKCRSEPIVQAIADGLAIHDANRRHVDRADDA